MDINIQKNSHNREVTEDCPNEEDSEPDSNSIQLDHRIGRFTIEELEDHSYNHEKIKYIGWENYKNIFNSNRKHTLSIEVLQDSEIDKIKNKISNDVNTSFIFDFNSNKFIDDVFIFRNIMRYKSIFKYTEMFMNKNAEDLENIDISDSNRLTKIEDKTIKIDILKNDGLKLGETVMYHEDDKYQIISIRKGSGIYLSSNKNSKRKLSYNSVIPTRKNRSCNELNLRKSYAKINIPQTYSPISSTKLTPIKLIEYYELNREKIHFNKYVISPLQNIEKVGVKLNNNFIKSVKDSFNLDDKKGNKNGKLNRKKRIYSADNKIPKKKKISKNNFEIYGSVEVSNCINIDKGINNHENNLIKYKYSALSIENKISFSSMNTDNKNKNILCHKCMPY